MRVLIITGGTSSERRISFMSAREVKKALLKNGYKVKLFDLKKSLAELKKIVKNFDCIFPVIHGEQGEGGNLQKFLAKLTVPFVGGDYKGFKKAWYKISFKKYCDKNKILTSPWKMIKNKDDLKKFGFPSVLKTSNGGSSREVVILNSEDNLKKSEVNKLLNSKNPLFIERYLEGIEVTCGILNNKALPLIEIRLSKGAWFDYKNKYWGQTEELINAPSLDEKTKSKIQKIALNIHKDFKLGSYSRIDLIVADNKPYVLEVNTIPGLTSTSLFPKAAQAAGMDFPSLVKKLILPQS